MHIAWLIFHGYYDGPTKTINMFNALQEALKFEHLPCWIMYGAEGSDPYFAKYVSPHTTAPAFAVLTPDDARIVASSLDADNLGDVAQARLIRYGKNKSRWVALAEALRAVGYPAAIGLSFSTLGDAGTDVLGHGAYLRLGQELEDIYREAGRPYPELVSAERILYALEDRKSARAISRLALAARWAHEILQESFSGLEAGMSEQEAGKMVRGLMQRRPDYLGKAGVIAATFSWEEEMCPIVLTGANLAKGGHALPSSTPILPGQTIYLDFGVRLAFSDGERWSSDIQRMGYFLKEEEADAPAEVLAVFEALKEAVSLGIAALRPGVPGYEVDEAVRGSILAKGYPDYDHSTGHPIGSEAHGVGTSLAGRDFPRAQLAVQPGGVYTIEPRIAIPNGGSIEEMVVAREGGGEAISPRQERLYLISHRSNP